MEAAVIESNVAVASTGTKKSKNPAKTETPAGDELSFELGLWLSGLESFLSAGNHSFIDKDRPKAVHDWTKEVRLTHSTLLLCSELDFRLIKQLEASGIRDLPVSTEELHELSLVLKDVILLSETLVRAEPLKFGVWKAWSNVLSDKLRSVNAFSKLIGNAEAVGGTYLPERLQELINGQHLKFADQSDLQQILPQFGRTLKWLSIIGRMLENDEPLKPALLIFSRIHEQTREMIGHINNRLARFPDEDAELFGSLDGASYTASLELKKVYNQELTGIVGVRPSLSIYSRIETAYSLLNDSFQHIVTGFARLVDPSVEAAQLFPQLKVKLDRSVRLREELWGVLQAVRSAEQKPDKQAMSGLQKVLDSFLGDSVNFLFSKDKESVERFVEEIVVTSDEKDLSGILHRFATYLETLFGQVNMRTVLGEMPFEPGKK